jgi:hypothetical protein
VPGSRTGAGGVADGRLEGAVAVAQKNTHVAAAKVGHGEAKSSVAGEIPHHQGTRIVPGGIVPSGLKGAVAISQQHTHVVAESVGDGHIENVGVVEVAHGQGAGALTDIKGLRGEEAGEGAILQHEQLGTVPTTAAPRAPGMETSR